MKKLLFALLPLFCCHGATLYVDGSASAGGNGSEKKPFATVQAAADRVNPGDTVIIKPGVYFETVRLKRFGTKDKPVTFKADKVKKNRVIITGADKAVRTGAKKWQLHDKKSATYFVKTANPSPVRVLYSGTDLFPYKSLTGLMRFEARPGVPGPRHGFYYQKASGKLFVRLRPDGKYGPADPNKHIMAISAPRESHTDVENPDSRSYNFGILGKVNQSLNVIIDGITFETPGRTAIYVSGNDVTVRNCLFLGCLAGGVSGRYIGEQYSKKVAESSKNVLVERCEWHNFPIFDDVAELIDLVKSGKIVIKNPKDQRFHYWVHKNPTNGALIYYETGIIRNVGKNWTLRNCYIHDVFDGIANLNWAENTIIEDNLFEKCIDNAVETENHAKNCHFRRNRCVDIFQSISYQPINGEPWAGPIYIYQNLVYRTSANIFKTGSSSTFKIGIPAKQAKNRLNINKPEMKNYDWINVTTPGVHIFNNTFIEPGIRLVGDLDGPAQKLKNITFSNNIAVSSALSYNLRRPGDGGVKVYKYTNNRFALTAKAYPLFPEVEKQVTRVPEDVLPGWKDNSFVPAKFEAAADIPGMPAKFKYIGALQSADEQIAANPGIAEDDVPEVKPAAASAAPAAPAPAAAVEETAAVSAADPGEKAVSLEWNILNDSSIAYEVVFDRRKLEQKAGFPVNCAFGVNALFADGKRAALKVTQIDSPEPGDVRLRFTVPANVSELYLVPASGTAKPTDGSKVANLISGILDNANIWKGAGIKASRSGNGILLEAQKIGEVTGSARMKLPAGVRGKPAAIELDVKSVSPLAYGTFIRLAQFDKNGKRLSESVSDPRWISHMRPPQVKSCYRVRGFIHPQAAEVALEISLATKNSEYDNYGRKISDLNSRLAKMEISRAALRCAGELVFPRYNDANFHAGVSGKPGDYSLNISDSTAFTHVTTSWATWGEDMQIRESSEWFWPDGDGTVECYFKPAQQSGKVTLFDAANTFNSILAKQYPARKSLVLLEWDQKSGKGVVMVKDGNNKVTKGAFKLPLETGKWNHVACQWSEKSGVSVYLNGKKVFSKQAEIAGINLKKVKLPSIMMPQNFTVGAQVAVARKQELRNNKVAKFQGDIDLLRVSSGERYSGNFTPQTEFKNDPATRALYNFNRSIDGVSGGGVGYMRGTFDSPRDFLDKKISCGTEKINYYPEELPAENDPDKAICRLNFPTLPTLENARASHRTVKKSFDVKAGDTINIAPEKQPYMDYVEITAGKETVKHPIVVNSGEIDSRSFGDIAESLELDKLTERQQMHRIFNFMIKASDYFTSVQVDFPADTDVPVRATTMALTMLNIYCGFNCGPLNDMLANIFTCSAGAPATRTYGFGHSFQQVYYKGKNRLYDLSAQRFFPTEGLEDEASLEDAEYTPNVLRAIGTSTDPRRHTFGPDHYIRLSTKQKVLQEPGFQQRVAYDLRPGESMRIYFNNAGLFNDLQSFLYTNYFKYLTPVNSVSEAKEEQNIVVDYSKITRNKAKYKVYKAYRVFPHYSNAFLRFDGKPSKSNPAFGKITSDSFCYRIDLPYTVTAARYRAIAGGKAVPLSISTDGGKTFHKLPLDSDGSADLDYEVRARHGYWVKINAPIGSVDNFCAITAVMLNPRVQTGRLQNGENKLKFRADTSSPAKVTFQYRVEDKNIDIDGALYSASIPGNERQLAVVEPGKSISLKVKGASDKTTVSTFGPVKASYADGVLTISADNISKPAFGAVILNDGGRKKELTLLAAKGAQLITADNITPGAGTKMMAPGGERLQKSLAVTKSGDNATVKIAPLEGGLYNVWMLLRAANVSSRMPLARLKASDGTAIDLGRTINHGSDFFKAQFGNSDYGRTHWDFAFKMSKGNFFYDRQWSYKLPAGCSKLEMTCLRSVKFEVSGLLIMPRPDRDFQVEMTKVLAGLNCEPWKIAADGIPQLKR